jgi:DNA invertase Pin-like site-specific DNA recombinase
MSPASDQPSRGLDLGYARVSTFKQHLERRRDALAATGIPSVRVYTDKKNLREVLNLVHELSTRGIGVRSLAGPLPINTTNGGMGRSAFLPLALFAEMERTYTAERAAHARAVAEAAGRHVGRPVAHSADRIEYARLLKAQGERLGQITAKTGIPKSSLHRYLAAEQQNAMSAGVRDGQ